MLCYRCGSHVADGSEACASCGQRFDTGLRVKLSQPRRRPLELEAGGIKPGDLVANRYEVRAILGVGPLGVVFRARDRQADVELALKVIAPNLLQSPEERTEFLKSLRLAQTLKHPHLVPIYDVGQAEASDAQPARAYFTAQLLEGISLRRVLDLRREKGEFFTLREAEPILAQIAQALDHANRLGPHGDLKPENVMVLPDLLELLDFGVGPGMPRAPFLAAQRQRKADVYMAPEVLSGRNFDRRADVFSLGVILGEMIAGVLPAPNGAPPPLRERQHDLPAAVEGLYRKALGSEPAARFAGAGEFAQELLVLSELAPPPLRAPGGTDRPRPPPPSLSPLEGVIAAALPGSVAADGLPSGSGRVARPLPPEPELDELAADLVEAVPYPSPDSAAGTAVRFRPEAPRPAGPWPLLVVMIALLVGAAWLGGRLSRIWETARLMETEAQANAAAAREPAPAAAGAIAAAAGRLTSLTDASGPPTESAAPGERGLALATEAKGSSPSGLGSTSGAPGAGLDDAGAQGALALAETVPLAAERLVAAGSQDPAPSALARDLPEGRPHELRVVQSGPDSSRPSAETPPRAELAPAPPVASCPAGMQLVSAGDFRLGTPAGDDLGNFGDRPERRAAVRSFCIDQYEYPNRPSVRPLTSVTAATAEADCRREGKRLCAEEEWEKACKGPGNHRFPYGDEFNELACRSHGGVGLAGAVSDCRSGYGVFDLSGNVAEWTASRFQPSSPDRAVKGGAVDSADFDLRCSARSNRSPGSRSGTLGFRCCGEAR